MAKHPLHPPIVYLPFLNLHIILRGALCLMFLQYKMGGGYVGFFYRTMGWFIRYRFRGTRVLLCSALVRGWSSSFRTSSFSLFSQASSRLDIINTRCNCFNMDIFVVMLNKMHLVKKTSTW